MFFFRANKVVIRKREEHNISRKNIDPDALRVLYRLSGSGFTAYLVGGSVRDLLMGRQPKDFDISTDAHPAQIRKLFRNCFLIGRRFRLAHIVFGRKVIETSTFRRQPQPGEADEGVPGGLYQHEDNTFGTPEEDARRRDFTVNGLFYDIRTFSVIDYVGGLRDLEGRVLRTIGDPNIRFREDPVRMMRAVRFSARLDFRMDWGCQRAIRKHYGEIVNATSPRLLEEVMRLFGHRRAAAAFRLLWEHRLMSVLLPEVHAYVERTGGARSPLWSCLAALDDDPINGDASNGLRVAVLYAPLFVERMQIPQAGHGHLHGQHVAHELLAPLCGRMPVPRQACYTACMLLDVQRRFEDQQGRRPKRLRFHHHDVLKEALALRRAILRATGGDPASLSEWEQLAHLPPPEAAPRSTEPDATLETVPAAGATATKAPADDAPMRRRRRRRRDTGDRAPAAEPLSPGLLGCAASLVASDSGQPSDAG